MQYMQKHVEWDILYVVYEGEGLTGHPVWSICRKMLNGTPCVEYMQENVKWDTLYVVYEGEC